MIRIEPSGFSTCDVELERSKASGAGNAVSVHLEAGRMVQGELGRLTTTFQRGSLQVVTTADAGQPKCLQYVFRADGVGVRLSVDTFSMQQSDSLETLCKIRDAATNAVVDALDNNRGDRISYPKDSIGGVDPCTRLENAEITAATKAASVTKSPAGPVSECRWDTGDYRITVSSGLMSASDSRATGTDETIAGRNTVIEPSSKKPTCRATFYGRSWDPWLGSHSNYTAAYNDDVSKFVEVTRLYVQLPHTGTGTATDACRTVRTLAAAAWPRLPHN
ncbi:hypothetical protein AB0L82_23055 [Nocardia sp. NPDC052001]|uniref:hypothetical protein n=1 Tax=Nocardia sp. NPDC052001 TaxID=3154853 RepID=UPI00341ABD97